MDNQRPSQAPQNKANLQRDYRERERLAFRNLLGAVNEVEPTNASSRREILRRADEKQKRLSVSDAWGKNKLTCNSSSGWSPIMLRKLLHCPTKISRGYKVIWLNRNILVSSQKDQEGRTEVEPK
ncbi:hypothetical protein P692DRAFT_201803520 [Suillus brevipes Sb2]|nr:hypothetical protein P692DRAFT_201803520 [Suillus brevipes Sb2]